MSSGCREPSIKMNLGLLYLIFSHLIFLCTVFNWITFFSISLISVLSFCGNCKWRFSKRKRAKYIGLLYLFSLQFLVKILFNNQHEEAYKKIIMSLFTFHVMATLLFGLCLIIYYFNIVFRFSYYFKCLCTFLSSFILLFIFFILLFRLNFIFLIVPFLLKH